MLGELEATKVLQEPAATPLWGEWFRRKISLALTLTLPLASLDLSHVQQFSRLLRDIVQRTGATVLYATHDLNWAAAYCDRMLVMQEGTLAVDDAPAQVMRPEVIARYFGFEADSIERNGRSWLVPKV